MSRNVASRFTLKAAQLGPARRVVRRAEAMHDNVLRAIGKLETHLLDARPPTDRLEDVEFRIFSQFGEDGILQYLVRHVSVEETTFVEIGVGSYRESNTRFLVENDNWRGIAVNGDDTHARYILGSGLAWRHDVEPVQAFVTAENVDQLITEHGFMGPVGVLSIDVDGVDYWIWKAITSINPAIVVIEFNALFGPDATVTVPYDPTFVDAESHYSRAHFGASLGALAQLGAERDYMLVGISSNATNAFFVHHSLADETLRSVSPQECWRAPRFLSSRNPDGTLSRVRSITRRLESIGDLPLIDVSSGRDVTVRDACLPATWVG